MKLRFSVFLLLLFVFPWISVGQKVKLSKNQIQPWKKNPNYWQYKGKPIMLLGGSNDDNLFQWTEDILIRHLDSMKQIDANYVRNTMSDRRDKDFEIYPYKQLETGKYDLNQWNEIYWDRFDFFLQETHKRKIIVQIEVWDRFDYSQKFWEPHPYNPKNNVNYSGETSGLSESYPDHPGTNKQPFFFTTPNQRNNNVLLAYQNRFVEKLLSYSLKYDHILYCIDNETSGEEEWAKYWSTFIHNYAKKVGKVALITEMWDNWDLKSEPHKRTFDYPERYAFCDVSQNNHQRGDTHWGNFQWAKSYISDNPRPINTVKTYGADGGRHGNSKDGIERWWKHLLGGAAAVRFHRPPSGHGLTLPAWFSIKAARKLESVVKYWDLKPDNEIIINRSDGLAYASNSAGKIYVIFVPNGGDFQIKPLQQPARYEIRYLNIRTGDWRIKKKEKAKTAEKIQVKTPDNKEWVIVIKAG